MTPDVILALSKASPAVITLIMAWIFLRYMQNMVCTFKKERQDFLQTINNHINHNTESIDDMKDAIIDFSMKQKESMDKLNSSMTILHNVIDKVLNKL